MGRDTGRDCEKEGETDRKWSSSGVSTASVRRVLKVGCVLSSPWLSDLEKGVGGRVPCSPGLLSSKCVFRAMCLHHHVNIKGTSVAEAFPL